LAAFEPESILCMTGPLGDRSEAEGRRIVIDGLRKISAAAREAGVRVGVEPVHVTMRDTFSFLTSLGDVIDLLDSAMLDDLGVMVDTYQVWDSSTVYEDIAKHGERITGVHLADWAGPGQPGHLLPGEGNSNAVELVRALAQAGWDGYLDVEAVSPDHLWTLDADEVARRAHASLQSVVDAALNADPA
jgi:sugar phosphate isomerase/epimerase